MLPLENVENTGLRNGCLRRLIHRAIVLGVREAGLVWASTGKSEGVELEIGEEQLALFMHAEVAEGQFGTTCGAKR